MKQPRFALLMLSAILFTVFACTKTGPTGAQGATGPQGPTGPTGPQGAQGDTGVANVQYSQWIDVEWTKNPSGSCTSNLITSSAITNQIIDSGIVLVYMRPDSSVNAPFQIPYTVSLTATTSFVIETVLQSGGGGITISGTTPTSGTLGAADIYPNAQIRYIIVPPGVAISSVITYDKISKLLNLTN